MTGTLENKEGEKWYFRNCQQHNKNNSLTKVTNVMKRKTQGIITQFNVFSQSFSTDDAI